MYFTSSIMLWTKHVKVLYKSAAANN